MIRTKLVKKEELFKILFIAYQSESPVLLKGSIGTGKTESFIDFSNSLNLKKVVRQMTYDTRKEELIGYIDPVALNQGRLERIGGLDESVEALLIDEIDKCNSANRNLLLSILNEKQIFDGSKIINLRKLRLIVGTTNSEIESEENAAFLDRFVIKYYVNRIGKDLLNIDLKEKNLEIKVLNDWEKRYEEAMKFVFAILENLDNEIPISDRRIVKIKEVLKLYAMYFENLDLYRLIGDTLLEVSPIIYSKYLPSEFSVKEKISKISQDLNAIRNSKEKAVLENKIKEILTSQNIKLS